MATTEKKILTLPKLQEYDEKLKAKIAADDAKVLSDAKSYSDQLADNFDPAGTAETKVNELANGAVKANTDAIAKLNGADTVEGSVAKQIKDAKTAIEEEIAASEYDDTALTARVSANEKAISTLNGTGEGSVKKQIDDAFNDFATKVSDDNVVNTYKELVDYCAEHSAEAAEMAGNITANKTAIATLEAFVGKLPEGTSAKTVIDYVNSKVASVDFSDAIATAKSEAISTASADAKTKADQALADAKTYADGKDASIAAAKKSGDDAQADVDALEAKVGTVATGKTVVQMISDAQTAATYNDSAVKASIKTNADAIDAVETRLDTLEATTFVEITSQEIAAMFPSA